MTLVIVLSVYTVNLLGVLQFSDNYLNDLASAFAARSYAPDDVLLVYAPQSLFDNTSETQLETSESQLTQLVSRLSKDGPSLIAIVHPISPSQQESLSKLPCADKLVIGRQLNSDEFLSPSLTSGYLDLCLEGQAVYREHVFKREELDASTGELTMNLSIEVQIARRTLGEELASAIPTRPVGIRFFGGVSGIPNVQSEDVIDGNLISEMVTNRVVMIGPETPAELGFVTPTTMGADRMSRLELHANFLQTLLHNNYLIDLSHLGILGVMFCVPLVCVHAFRNLGNRWMIRSWLALLAIVCCVCWSCLSIWSLRMPVTAMLLATSLSFVSVLYLRFRALKDLVDNWRLLRGASEHRKLRSVDGDRWSAMADSVSEVFNPQRVVLMKLAPGSTHLQVAQMRGCDQDSICEQRRDVHRYPFDEAIQQNYPIQIDGRRFMHEVARSNGREFMVPLVMLSEVIGFMVLEMDAAKLERWSDFESCLARYSSDMAIFLAGSGDDDELSGGTDLVRQPMRALPEQEMAASLIKNEVQHRSFGKMLDNAFDSAETALAVGDIFGQLVKVNVKMIALMQREDVSTQNATCVDILATLTQRDENECRKLFRRCIIEDRSEQIVLASKSAEKSSSVLFVRPLSTKQGDQLRGIDGRFVAIEIVSGEIFDAINHWQRQFLAAQSNQIDRQMDLLLQIAGDLEIVKRDGGSQTDPYVSMAREVLQSVNECRAAVGNNLTDSPTDHFLLDTQPILSAALKSCSEDLTAQGITVHRTMGAGETIANANPFLLEQIFLTIIDCLVADCDEETQLRIAGERHEEVVRYRFSTQNTQIETTELEHCLFGATETEEAALTPTEDALVTQQHLDRLRESNRWLQRWGAKLTIDCDVYYRVSISLDLTSTESASPTKRVLEISSSAVR